MFEIGQRLRVPAPPVPGCSIVRHRTDDCQGIPMALDEGTQAGRAVTGRHAPDIFEAWGASISHGAFLFGIGARATYHNRRARPTGMVPLWLFGR